MYIKANNSSGGGALWSDVTALSFRINKSASDIKVCKLTGDSKGVATYAIGAYGALYKIDGKTVTKVSGNATASAYYVSGDYLYAHNGSAETLASSYGGTITDCDPTDTGLTAVTFDYGTILTNYV